MVYSVHDAVCSLYAVHKTCTWYIVRWKACRACVLTDLDAIVSVSVCLLLVGGRVACAVFDKGCEDVELCFLI
jgi:hypothetical protein